MLAVFMFSMLQQLSVVVLALRFLRIRIRRRRRLYPNFPDSESSITAPPAAAARKKTLVTSVERNPKMKPWSRVSDPIAPSDRAFFSLLRASVSADSGQRPIDQSPSALRGPFLIKPSAVSPRGPRLEFHCSNRWRGDALWEVETECGRLSGGLGFISLISISGLLFHFHLLGSLLAISSFICSPLFSLPPPGCEGAARPSGRPLS